MSETPQKTLAAYLASPSSGALWEIGVREAIRAVLEGLEQCDGHGYLREEVARAEAERDTLKLELEKLRGPK